MGDYLNGLFELVGAYFIWMNVVYLYKDKNIAGIYWPSWAFFAAWGLWNLYYYPSLDQWFSFSMGILLVSGNVTWVLMAMWYKLIKGKFK